MDYSRPATPNISCKNVLVNEEGSDYLGGQLCGYTCPGHCSRCVDDAMQSIVLIVRNGKNDRISVPVIY